MIDRDLIKRAQSAVVPIGYYLSSGKEPKWLGTGFLIGNESSALTCLHIVDKRPLQIGNEEELSIWLFWNVKNQCHKMRFPIKEARAGELQKVEATYVGKARPDAAYLKLDISQWKNSYGDSPMPFLPIEDQITSVEVGDEIIVVGYPAPHFLIEQKGGAPNVLEPIVQFGRIAGILPASISPAPHLLALDIVSTYGSSGSPVIRVSDGKVIGISCEILLNRMPFVEETPDGPKAEKTFLLPTGISYAVPSNLFAHFAILPGGAGKFEVKPRW